MIPSVFFQFDKKQKQVALLLLIPILISLFVNLGVHPLYLEEPRRALIALEMIFNKNLIVPTEFGLFYCKKTPLYNWLIIFCYKISGSYSEFATRIPTVLSHIGMAGVLYWVGNKYVNLTFGILAAILWLVALDIYYYFSILAEIDVFYSLITLLSFFTLFHFYQKKQFTLVFVTTYGLSALGALTKGFPSIVFLAISLPVFFFYNKDFKRLFTPAHFLGIGVFLLIIASYFIVYSNYNTLECYLNDLWSQSSERTLLEKSFTSLFSHIVWWPVETLKNVLPASIFLIFVFKKDFFTKIRENKLIEFCFYIFLSNSIIYWLSPGSRARYVYMLYPLVILILLYFFMLNDKENRTKLFHWVLGVLIAAFLIVCSSLPWIPALKSIDNLVLIAAVASVSLLVALILYIKYIDYRFLTFVLCLVILRFVFNFTILPSRASGDQQAQIEKVDAAKITTIVGEDALYMFDGIILSHTSVFYIERGTEKVLGYKYEKNTDDFFIVRADQLEGQQHKVFYEFNSGKEKKYLIKFL